LNNNFDEMLRGRERERGKSFRKQWKGGRKEGER
jgi:hypothetical protein